MQKMCIEELKLLQAQNEELKKQNTSLQQEVKQWKHEYEMLDAVIELLQMPKEQVNKYLNKLSKIERGIK